MRTVHRFDLAQLFNLHGNPMDRASVMLPQGARVIHVALQDRAPHSPSMWIELDESMPGSPVEFAIVGTGYEIPDGWMHVGTWQQDGYVWHLFQAP